MQKVAIKSRYYSVKELKVLENCGKDKAYSLAKQLPHERRGRDIYVFAEAYEEYYRQKMESAKVNTESKKEISKSNIYTMRKFS